MSEVAERLGCVPPAMSESLLRRHRPTAEGRWLHRAGVARRRAASSCRFAFGRAAREDDDPMDRKAGTASGCLGGGWPGRRCCVRPALPPPSAVAVKELRATPMVGAQLPSLDGDIGQVRLLFRCVGAQSPATHLTHRRLAESLKSSLSSSRCRCRRRSRRRWVGGASTTIWIPARRTLPISPGR